MAALAFLPSDFFNASEAPRARGAVLETEGDGVPGLPGLLRRVRRLDHRSAHIGELSRDADQGARRAFAIPSCILAMRPADISTRRIA